MSKTTKKRPPRRWTAAQAAQETGVNPTTLARGLRRVGLPTGHGVTYTLRQIVDAAFDESYVERVLSIRAKRRLLELKRRKLEADLVDRGVVVRLLREAFAPVAAMVEALPAELSTKANPADPDFAHKALDQWVDRSMKQIQAGITAAIGPKAPRRPASKSTRRKAK